MAKVLIIGCGDLGTAIAQNLQQNHMVIGLRRSLKPLPNGMQTLFADVTQADSLTMLADLNPNIVIYCVSAGGSTDAQYQASYVQGLKNVLATQTKNTHLQHVFFVSSTRVYGQITDEILDENTPAIPSDFGGERLLEAENALKEIPCESTSMRLSGIYGKDRLYLVNMAQDPNRWPENNSWSNRIYRDDAANFIAFIVNKTCNNEAVKDCYIVTDNMPTLQYDVLTWLAKQQNIDVSAVKTPPQHGGKRLSNRGMRATGFALQYPNYQLGYSKILKNNQ
jgi:nucleoside-diphosphate-sugar epimerase